MTLPRQQNATNFVEKIIYDPCTTDVWIYVRTFLPAFVELFITVTFIDLFDIVRNRGYEQTRRQGRTTRGRPIHGGLWVPPKDKTKVQRWSSKGLQTLLILTDPLEKIGFFFLVYGAVDKFFWRWMSLIEEAACNVPQPGFARNGTNVPCFPNAVIGALVAPDLVYQRNPVSSQSSSCSFGEGTWTVIMAATFDGETPSNSAEYKAALQINGGFPFGTITQGGTTIGASRGGDIMIEQSVWVPPGAVASVGWGVQGPAVPVGLLATSVRVRVMRQTSGLF